MPIYEFYCQKCNTIYNFFSKTINTEKVPKCPQCKNINLSKQMSLFSVTGKTVEKDNMDDFPIDESKMAKAMQMLEKEAGKIDENDPSQAAGLIRKLSDASGLKLGPGMDEAINRMEKGEDPDQVESELSHLIENEDPFIINASQRGKNKLKPIEPNRDETLYDL